jgi:ketohexokinase
MARILAVGIATLDIVNEVEHYPAEDDEVRAVAQTVRRGGNATNTLVVLAGFGHRTDWAGVQVLEPGNVFVASELESAGVGTRYCTRLNRGRIPTSYITLSRSTGSRTIVHYRDLPEYEPSAFATVPIDQFDWVHFEGRNIDATEAMMLRVRTHRSAPVVSVEVEKPRDGMARLYPHADLMIFSAAIADSLGVSPSRLLEQVRAGNPRAVLVCTLGENGAVALDAENHLVSSPGFAPERVVDTIGAGDTFNAALIDAMLRGLPLAEALRFACRLAGRKCGQRGFQGLRREMGSEVV